VRRFAAVLFDNGDTLFHKPLAPPAIEALAARMGRPISEAEAVAAWASVKAHKRSITDHELVFGRNRSAGGHKRYYTACYEPLDDITPGLADSFYAHFKTNPESMIPYPDTRDVLGALHDAGMRIGIVSNTGWDIRAGYRLARLDQWIDTFALSFEHGTAKPEHGLFEIACSDLDVEPSEVLMVGNNGFADSGAAGLGCTCLVLPPVARGEPRGLEAALRLSGVDDTVPLTAA
jgi:FMN phosphatase YigB (HAD superfamily)